ncbi:hypothetical protein LTR91_006388 [Friedmanniomyces endolithicus]|uniref:Uncharacterized protein n=2 Tax=Friedmanniomyces endolithicus TaxID=329885 RepID=A0AAN6KRR4_9PEZI|nr:hypothetical protein LTR35_002141 [Friedmanniomyces endolithicus]KAK0299815.1 hypothetical protein LTS00_001585 [Friedmanniomyces endolithicus]KAK0319293.1 hypothetical protein LTR82_009710 [Friedmanniomyces endolithicus]KAK0909870.1 hypothetical protein LTR57_016132 [Friedmanniomyces endolithicus]KAK0965716.1 hypothetical protein LTS01_018168 [Friedmanniomyces endolithicus]
MSSKFFTWTKGDRRYAANPNCASEFVPIPVECISIKGLEYSRETKGSKASRKPQPLTFDYNAGRTLDHEHQTSGSIALHDAAVQSATNLMAVVNDMLQSPHVSAHLSAQRRNALSPMYCRPRSRTAPPTPLFEAPCTDAVELPGSLLAGRNSIISLHKSIDGDGVCDPIQLPTTTALGATIKRPHSSPQQATYIPSAVPRHSSDSFSHAPSLPVQSSTQVKGSSPREKFYIATRQDSDQSTGSDGTIGAPTSESSKMAAKRPSVSVLQRWPQHSSDVGSEFTTSHAGSFTVLEPQILADDGISNISRQQLDAEVVLLEQITRVRSSHDAHLASLHDAHQRELDSHRLHIAFLEQRQQPAQAIIELKRSHLTLDTSHNSSKSSEAHSANVSATTDRSCESPECQKRASLEAAVETEGLKRKLSLAKKAQSESGEVKRERDRLRLEVERGSRRIMQLKEIVRKSKDQEKCLRNAVADLECRLVAANNERTDVLEGLYEASEQLQKIVEHKLVLEQEVGDLRRRVFFAEGRNASNSTVACPESNFNQRPEHCRTRSDVAGLAVGKDPARLTGELKRAIAARDFRIQQLEYDLHITKGNVLAPTADADRIPNNRVNELEALLGDHKTMLRAAREDRDRYNSLLHHEIRRHSRTTTQTASAVATPKMDGDAVTDGTQKAHLIPLPIADRDPAILAAVQEREINKFLEDIILYKLDIRGLRKDLKRAHAQLAELKATSAERPPTSDRDSLSSVRSDASSTRKLEDTFTVATPPSTIRSGLGIHLPQTPRTPQRTPLSATSAALSVASPSMPMSPPPSRPKTPIGTYKKLPKPPTTSRTPSPLPTTTLHRDGTLRSVSESIISSYTKRETPRLLHLTPTSAAAAPGANRA